MTEYTSYTKGPWNLVLNENKEDWDEEWRIVTPEDNDFMVNTPYYPWYSNNVYDAHLIAAAPELLELAKLMENFLEYQIEREEILGHLELANLKRKTLESVRQTIAKAEGR